MKILVTGANGFLGRHVVDALCRAGHSVRVVVRSVPAAGHEVWDADVDIYEADLRSHPDLLPAFQGVDAVVHLAASMSGDDVHRFADTATGTERLFAAMARSSVQRIVLCSSFSVYDWLQAHGTVDERLSTPEYVYANGGYATAKLWQERMAERMVEKHGWELTIIRPGFIWGAGNECPDGSIGRSLGGLHLVFTPLRQLPITHVENCADCFRGVVENPDSIGHTFNLVDNHGVTAWKFMGEYLRRSRSPGIRVPIPYRLMWLLVGGINLVSPLLLGPRAKIPSVFSPAEFAQCYRPLRYSTKKLQEVLGWTPPLNHEQCIMQTHPQDSSRHPAR